VERVGAADAHIPAVSLTEMRRGVLLGCIALALATCGGDGDDSGGDDPTTTSSSTSTSSPASTTTTAPVGPLADVRVTLTPVADVQTPTALAVRADDPALYVAEQGGRIVAVTDGQVAPVLDISDAVSAGGERGLLGITFSPDGSRLYVHYSDVDGNTQLDEYAMGGEGIGSRRPILSVDQPQANHNGGELVFGPDGMLWLGLGDGGGAGDEGPGHAAGGNGQSLDTLLGKILRIDPSRGDAYAIPPDNPFADGGGLPEIWSYGLRNPWRFSFDRETGDLWVADVGQNAWEEVNVVAAPRRGAGVNFGWNHLEGTNEFRGGAPSDAVPPIVEHSHDDGSCSVTGGYVYRGDRIPQLRGAYLYSDYCAGTVRAVRLLDAEVADRADLPISAAQIAAFGQDLDGELYVLSQSDGLLRIDPESAG